MTTLKYVNTNRGTASSEYMQVEPSVDGSMIRIDTKRVAPVLNGVVVPMVRVSAILSRPRDVLDPCKGEPACAQATEAVRIDLNLLYGDSTSCAALRAELNRVLDKAIEDYYVLNGVVPPVDATFANA